MDPADETIRFNEDAAAIEAVTPDAEPNLSSLWVRALEHDAASNVLFVGGRFQEATGRNGTFNREGVFGCDLDNGQVANFDPPIDIEPFDQRDNGFLQNERIRALAFDGTYLYVGGKFRFDENINLPNQWDDRTHYNLARFNVATSALDTSWAPNIRGGVSALEISGGSIFASGGIWQAGGSPASRLVRISIATGVADEDFRPMFIPEIPTEDFQFASVSALEAVQGQIVAGGAFQYVIANPSDRAWELHTDKVSQGELLTAQELAEINAVRRNSVAAITINGQQLTPFSPSIGDNNLDVDEIAQIRDVVSDGQGNIFVCGDWWVTAPSGNQFWQTFDADAGEPNPNNSTWEGQTSKYQPRPNQHNFGKFNLTNGNSVMVGGRIWGATTDGGVQACDYEPETDTLIIGGHYDRIGPYDPNYVDTAFPENNYPAGHLALRKVNAIDAATGRLLEWDPGVTTFRGVDAVRVLPGPDGPRVSFGGAFTDVDRETGAGLALYGFGEPR